MESELFYSVSDIGGCFPMGHYCRSSNSSDDAGSHTGHSLEDSMPATSLLSYTSNSLSLKYAISNIKYRISDIE